jgi:ethanolamine ammonia-lyase small subunit
VVDGLSALAVQRHAAPLIAAVLANEATSTWRQAPVAIVEQGRVAVGDEIGALLSSRIVIVLIGERPGLSSPDSLGIYLTWAPRPGRNDAERNCISNVRPEGLNYRDAAAKLVYLLEQALSRQLTGVGLKDESGAASETLTTQPNFLLGEPPSSGP